MEQIPKRRIMNISSWIPCPHCKNPLPIADEINILYFCGVRFPCPECNNEVDWWKTILGAVKTDFFLSQILAPIGAQTVIFQITLSPDTPYTLNFEDCGIPNDGKLLEINYTPIGDSLFPLEMHGNVPRRHFIPHKIVLYPRPIPSGTDPKETKVSIMATWIPHTINDNAWQNLVDSFEAYSQDRYRDCIVPANVAVESRLIRLLTKYLHKFASKKHIEDFLENGATYSHQLNVVLPLAVTQLGVPLLSDEIRGLLNRLRGLRNELAHSGKTEKEITKDEFAEMIVAALFGFHYLNLLEKKLGST